MPTDRAVDTLVDLAAAPILGLVDDLDRALDALLAADLVGIGDDGLLEVMRRFEAHRQRMPLADHRLIAEVTERRLADRLCASSTRTLLRGVLRITPGEATRRVRAAADLGPRRTLTGEPMLPLFRRVATAQAAGLISPEHARIVISAVDRIPHAIQRDYEAVVEAQLVEHAMTFDPTELAKIARLILDGIDPDGTLADDADHERQRDWALSKNRDGSSTPGGRFSPQLTALIEAFLDARAAPVPAADGARDPRTAGQRNHDALYDGFTHLLTCAEATDGVGATLLLSMTVDQFTTGQGLAMTAHGDPISVPNALELVSATNGQVLSVLFNPTGGIRSYGQTKRLVPRRMRLAITARDRGCTFPGCDAPPAWTQAHHFEAFSAGGPTSISNCGLVCGYHHRQFQKRGWKSVFVDGRPHWLPPAWIDPTQTPRRNPIHDVRRRT